MKHKDKVKLARKLRTKEELKRGVGLFQTEAWNKRKEARKIKELKKKYGNDWKNHYEPSYTDTHGSNPKVKYA